MWVYPRVTSWRFTPARRRLRLERRPDPLAKANDNVVLKRDSTEFTIEPNQIKLRLDAYASVHAAGGNRSLNPVRMIGLLTGGGTHPLVIRDNPTSTNSLLQVIAQELDKPEVEPFVYFDNGKPVVRNPG